MSDAPTAPKPGLRQRIARLPRWKKISIAVAATLLLLALVLKLTEGPPVAPAAGGGQAVTGFDSQQGSESGPAAANRTPPLSGGMFRLGFSFFAGFSIGYLLRQFLKMTALAAGLAILLLIGLENVGFADIHWSEFSSAFDTLLENIKAESDHIQTFLTGSLPRTGLAVLGLATGFKR